MAADANGAIEDLYPLSPMQHGMLFHALYAPEGSVYVQQLTCVVEGALDMAAFEAAWEAVVHRHAVLRTSFVWDDVERPLQVVERSVAVPIRARDWRGVPEADQGEHLEAFLREDRARSFDLREAPLFRLTILRVGEDRVRVVWTHHHLILDGWSLPIVLGEVFRHYAASVRGAPLLLLPARPFRALLTWHREQGARRAESLEHWRRALAGFTAATRLPLADGRAGAADGDESVPHKEIRTRLSEAETARLVERARRERVTLAAVVNAAWALVLERHEGKKDVAFGVTVSGRPPELAGADATVGMFINTIPVRVALTDDEPIADLLRRTHAALHEHLGHDHLSLAEIQQVSDVRKGKPLFESLVVVEGYPYDDALRSGVAGVVVRDVETRERTSYPLTLVAAPGSELAVSVLYDDARYTPRAAEQVLARVVAVLRTLAAGYDGLTADLEIAPPAVAVGARMRDAEHTPVHALFESQAASRPDAIAVVHDRVRVTYAELDQRANRLAHALCARGVRAGEPVALCVERSIDLVVAVLGILKAGAAYVPLDPAYPLERLRFQLRDSGAATLVTRTEDDPTRRGGDWPSVRKVDLSALSAATEADLRSPLIRPAPEDLAYVIYTSGSSGVPKGVAVTHANVARLFTATQAWFAFGPADVWTLFHSIAFDFSVWELFGALVHGGTLIVVPYWVSRSPESFRALLASERVTVLSQTPSAFDQLVAADLANDDPLALRLVIFGGEALRCERLAPWFARHGDSSPRLVNMFGITETTVHVTYRPLSAEDCRRVTDDSPIGVAIPDLTVDVLDQRGRRVPSGVPGELVVGGAGVARGYLGRPELTRERFVELEGRRVYRTGDRARFDLDGELLFLGRLDEQLKIRGFRIEPGEIESVLVRHPAVRACVVSGSVGPAGDARLVAYVVRERDVSVETLRAHAAEHLYEAMVPAAFVVVDELPLTVNGKVDRARLARSAPADGELSPPAEAHAQDALEELLGGIWAQVLHVERIGRDDDVFHHGAHSLLATQAASRIRAAIAGDVPLRLLFESPTPRRLAAALRARARSVSAREPPPPIQPLTRDSDATLPASFAQQRLWFLDRLDTAQRSLYTIPAAVRIRGPLDASALARAFERVVLRHESLRTVFVEEAGAPRQKILVAPREPLRFVDLRTLPDGEREAEARRLAIAAVALPFDLATGPLVRVTLFRLDDRESIALFALHHVVADAWSIGILLRDLVAAYRGDDTPPLRVQYGDFAVWQRRWLAGEPLLRELAYFKDKLDGAPAVIDLPLDRPRRARPSYRGADLAFALSEEETRALIAKSQAASCTLFMVLLAGLHALLARVSGEDDVSIGVSIAGRSAPDTEALIGFFVNVLVLRARIPRGTTVAALLASTRKDALDAYDHQDVPFERVVEAVHPARSLGHSPLFQVNFVYQNVPVLGDAPMLPLALSPVALPSESARFDLVVSLDEPRGGPLRGSFTFATDVFDEATVARIAKQYAAILRGLAADDDDADVWSLPLGDEREDDADHGLFPGACLHELIAAQAARTPAATAVACGESALSYADLEARANRLARHLRGLGVRPGTRVGIALPQRPARVVALLGVLKAGGVFVPIDAAEPLLRKEMILELAKVSVIVTDDESADELPSHGVQVVFVDDALKGPESPEPPPAIASLDDEAYVIFTSGSTGRPKGVVIGHRGLGNLARAQVAAFDVVPSDRVLQFASFAFDASISEIAMALCAGATLDLGGGGDARRELIVDVLREREITLVTLPPSLLRAVDPDAPGGLPKLRAVIAAGEACFDDVARAWAHGRRFFNAYGPTECTVCATIHEWRDSAPEPGAARSRVPIGRAMRGVRVSVLDAAGRRVPPGVAGELHVGGAGVALGYVDATLDEEAFVTGERLYRTGDIVRERRDGALEFLRRVDDQVKVRGHRIELAEAAFALAVHPSVRDAAVAVADDRLIGYVVCGDDARPSRAELLRAAGEHVPMHMVPSCIVFVAELPRTPSGKLDRAALPAPSADDGSQESRTYVPPEGTTESVMSAIWCAVLGVTEVGRTDDFFALGGHSLIAAQLVARVRGALGLEVPMRAVFEAPTLAAYASAVAALPGSSLATHGPSPRERGAEPALSFAQERLWFLEQLQPGTSAYVLSTTLRLSGPLDVAALRAAIEHLVARHEALRTRFPAEDGRPAVRIDADTPPDALLCVVDVADFDAGAREAFIDEARRANANRPFDLAGGPLFRATLIELSDRERVLLFAVHHIVADAWSMGILVRELAILYRAGPSALPPLALQYADWAAWERATLKGARLATELAFWTRQLEGCTAALELPTDRARAALSASRGARIRRTSTALWRQTIERAGARAHVTPFMLLLAAFQLLLHRRSGSRDIAVGTPVARRAHAESDAIVGLLVNTLVLRARFEDADTVGELLESVRDACLGAYAHQDVPFEVVVDALRVPRDLGRNPLFQALFTMQARGLAEPLALEGVEVLPMDAESDTAKLDLSFAVTPVGDAFEVIAEYRVELFDATTIEGLVSQWLALAESLARALPDAPLRGLSMGRVPAAFCSGPLDSGADCQTLVEEIESRARSSPEKVAVTSCGTRATYGALLSRARAVAAALQANGVVSGDRVGVSVRRGVGLVESLLGVLLAGAAYVPLESSQPASRASSMARTAGVRVVVTDASSSSWVGLVDASLRAVRLEDVGVAPAWEGARLAPGSSAYVLFTSGSTGEPKGVEVSHGNVANVLVGMSRAVTLTSRDVWLAVTPVSFDIAGLELWGPLAMGATVHVASEEETRDGALLSRCVRSSGATVMQATPSTWRMLLAAEDSSLGSVRKICGGEALTSELASELLSSGGEFWNAYGPTETTIWSTLHQVSAEDVSRGGYVSIGSPLLNTQAHVVDAWGEDVAVGVAGELWLGGAGVAVGYVGDAERTRERFVSTAHGRVYRTGDRARWRDDGSLSWLGRDDEQVKIRGHRVELGEVESELGRCAGVREAAAKVHAERAGESELVAYVVGETTLSALRAALRSRLPEAMVPSSLVTLTALPRTSNGKLDRKALPAPSAREVRGGKAPASATEEMVLGIWSEVLGRALQAVDEDFFELGGHSLLATQIAARVRRAFGVELPLRRFFEEPTVAAIARAIDEARDLGAACVLAPIAPRDPSSSRVPSFAQERMWFLAQIDPADPVYNLPAAVHLTGALDIEALGRAISAVLGRHEPLRTTFAFTRGALRLDVAAAATVHVDAEKVARGELERWLRAVAATPFDLMHGPVLRVRLARVGEHEHVLAVVIHHVAADAWSMRLLIAEIAAVYRSCVSGENAPLPALARTYADYSAWQRRELRPVFASQLVHWQGALRGIAPLDLPADRPRASGAVTRGARATQRLSRESVAPLRELARAEGATPFMAMLAAFQILLARYAGTDDVAVGTPVGGRRDVELEPLVGLFVNTIVLRTSLAGSPTPTEIVRRVRRAALDGYANQDVPFGEVVQAVAPARDPARTPLFQVMFMLHDVLPGAPVSIAGLTLTEFSVETGAAPFELTLALTERGDGSLDATLEYRVDLYDEITARRMLEHYTRIVEALPGCQGPVDAISLGDEVARFAVPPAVPSELTSVDELIARTAARTPGAIAIASASGDAVTYAALDAGAARLAGVLRELGVADEVLVSLCLERTPRMIVTMLAVWRAGGAYVPLEPAWPDARKAWVRENAGVSIEVDADGVRSSERLVRWDEIERALPAALPTVSPGSRAYVLYTSGSTGAPKGVEITHGSVANLAHAMAVELELTPRDRVLQFASLCFDASIEEIVTTLSVGATLVLRASGAPGSVQTFLEEVTRAGVTVLDLPTALWHAWVDEAPDAMPESVRLVVVGGEAASLERLARWRASHAVRVVWINTYGPTEATVTATSWALRPGDPMPSYVPIGRPIANVRAYVLDAARRPAPLGVPGDLWIAGAGLARGYWHAPNLTAAAFVEEPPPREGGRMYRTGDRARWRDDGNLEFLGRVDRQLKMRGLRIEPAEIEATLRAHEGVRDAVVVPRDGRLVAYVVPASGSPSLEHIRVHCVRRLPDYMVPASYVAIGAIPRTVGEKVDYALLPAPAREIAPARVAPRTELEASLASIWAELLGAEEPSTDDDFFALGGHSLLATQLFSRIRSIHGVDLPIRALFEHPTIAGLALRIEEGRGRSSGVSPTLVSRPDGTTHPLSFAQQRLYFLHRLAPADPFYNLPAALELLGPLRIDALQRSFEIVLQRHEVLRATFHDEDGRPVQRIAAPGRFELPVVPVQGRHAARLDEAHRLATDDARVPFDLARGPLLRASLVAIDPEHHVLVVTMHHLVADGWSTAVLLRELGAAYAALSQDEEPRLPPLPIQYADFAHWQRAMLEGEELARQLAFWQKELDGAPTFLELPTDFPRPPEQSFAGADVHFTWPVALRDAVRALADERHATSFMVVLSAFQALLGRYAGASDVLVGVSVANRNRLELEALIGFFVNILVVRADLSGDPTFSELLAQTTQRTLDAQAHQDLPFDKLVEALRPARTLEHSPVFQVNFVWQNAPEAELALPGLALVPLAVPAGSARFDLILAMEERDVGLAGTLTFRTDLFEESTIHRVSEHLRAVLEGATARPETRVSALPVFAGTPRTAANDTTPAPDCGAHALFEEVARRFPESIALHHGEEQTTYAELDRAANRLAAHLRAMGVGRGTRVGIAVARTPERIRAVLAVWKAGASYVPIDTENPAERLALMLEQAAVAIVVADLAATDQLPQTGAPVVVLEDAAAAIARCACDAAPTPVRGEDEAYVMFTSGSTGRPKGVVVLHRGVANLARSQREAFGIRCSDRVLQFAPFGFDASVSEIVMALTEGASLDLGERAGAPWGKDEPLEALLRRRAITVVTLPPSLLREMSAEDLPALRVVISAGEPCDASLARTWAPLRAFFNAYGPTEATVCATLHRVDVRELARGRRVPIGAALPNVTVHLLGAQGERVPTGAVGEICIAGAGVAAGYVGAAELTRERFVADPFGPGLMYRTGDRARDRGDGVLEYVGRADEQVKVRGHRVEPGDVEHALRAHPRVVAAAVVLRELGARVALVAYVVLCDGDAAGLRAFLETKLPEHMIPARFIAVASLPRTPAGKTDRRALPAPDADVAALERAYVAPRTHEERTLAALWAAVLGIARVGAHDNFFELGGDSIASLQIVARAAAAGLRLTPKLVFEHQTLERLASAAASSASGRGASCGSAGDGGEYPLSPLQEGMLFHTLYAPESRVYVSQLWCKLRGPLDLARLRAAWEAVTRRHDVLRTAFAWEGRARPMQIVKPTIALPLEVVEAGGDPTRFREEERARGFDPRAAPLFRLAILRHGDDEHELVWTHHHLILDGWSVATVLREVMLLGAGHDERELGVPRPYRSYIDWLARLDRGGEEAYWRGVVATVTEPTALGIGAPRRPRAAVLSVRELASRLSATDTARLTETARAHALTPSTLVTGAWAVLLARYAMVDEVVFGVTVAGRPPALAEGEALVGLFINTLPVRVKVAADREISAWLGALQRELAAMREHEHTPLATVHGWSGAPRGEPLFESILIYENFRLDDDAPEGTLRVTNVGGAEQTSYPLTIVAAPGERLELRASYDVARFDESSIRALLARLERLLIAIARAPAATVGSLSLLNAVERREALRHAAGLPRDSRGTVLTLFAEHVARAPDRIAIEHRGHRVSYATLDARARAVAGDLHDAGIARGGVVAVCVERCPALLVALLAAWKSGAALVPLEPSHPDARLAFQLSDSSARVIIASERTAARVRVIAGDTRVVVVKDTDARLASGDGACEPADVAYVLYTSGSTGRPKGVVVTHAALANYLMWARDAYGFGSGGAPMHTSMAFDLTLTSALGPLVSGDRVVLAEEGSGVEPLVALLEARAPSAEPFSVLKLTPSHLVLLAAAFERAPPRGLARVVVVGGEALPSSLARAWRRIDPGARIVNEYGPTEACVGCVVHESSADEPELVPIGRPIANMSAYVLDGSLQPCAVGVLGELCLAGVGVARGYLDRDELTRERFLANPFGRGTLYRTGDRARRRGDGVLEYVGRADDQIKLRGYRVELGEVEGALRRHPAVLDAAVVATRAGEGAVRLAAYVVPSARLDADELLAHMRRELPEPFVPTAFAVVDALPLNANGKIDRAELAARPVERGGGAIELVPARTDAERALVAIWEAVLARAPIGANHDFFALGGDSILALQVIARASAVGLSITPKQVFEHPTLGALAAQATRRDILVTTGAESGDAPLTPVQAWFFEKKSKNPSHYNQSVLFAVRGALDAAALEDAFAATLDHHGVSRVRFAESPAGWVQRHGGEPWRASWKRADLSHLDDERVADAVEAHCSEAQRALDLGAGRLAHGLLLELGRGRAARLLLVVHHLVVDAVSWRPLLGDLREAYAQRSGGGSIALAPDAARASFFAWSRALAAHASSDAVRAEAGHWLAAAAPPLAPLPRDGDAPDAPSHNGGARVLRVLLDADETRALNDAAAGWDARVHELLLAALARTLSATRGEILIDVEGHGREELAEAALDLSRTVGWFTAIYPLRLGWRPWSPLSENVAAVRERVRAVPGGGVGYGVLRYLARDPRLTNTPRAEVSFNYLGRLDAPAGEAGPFGPAPESRGDEEGPDELRLYAIEINGFTSGGQLQVEWAYDPIHFRVETAEAMVRTFVDALHELARARPQRAPLAPQRDDELLVALQPAGTETPLFLVHPVGGLVGCYADLARALGVLRPILGIQAQGIDGSGPLLTDVEAMARRYCDAVRKARPRGPYILGGWSMGAIVALEMARVFALAGERASLIALDQTPSEISRDIDDATLLAQIAGDVVPVSVGSLRARTPEGQIRFVLEEARRLNVPLGALGESELRRHVDACKTNFRALAAFQPRPMPGKVVVFRASDRVDAQRDDPHEGWLPFAGGGVVVRDVPGDHVTMLRRPHVHVLAGALRRELDVV